MTDYERPIDAWLWHFELKLGSHAPMVYNNGRQQIKVDINIQAADDANEPLTQAQLDSLTLVVKQRNGQYAPLSINSNDAWYFTGEHDPRFDYYPSLTRTYQEPAQANAELGILTQSLFISSNANAGSTLEVRARITRSPGKYYYTDTQPFDSSLTVTARSAPTSIVPQDYTFEKVFEEGSENSGTFIHEWALAPRDIGFAYAEFLPGYKQGTIRWHERASEETYATHVGIVLPGDTAVQYDDSLPIGDDFRYNRKVHHIQQPPGNRLVVVVQGDHNIPYVPGHPRREQPLNIHAVDRYGTSHHLDIGFDGQQRVELRVTPRRGLAPRSLAAGTLDHFQVLGLNRDRDNTTCVVYANGYQQTEVSVLVRARDANGMTIAVPDNILANIEFIDYNTGALLPRARFQTSLRKDEAYDYHRDNHSQLGNFSSPGQGSVKKFYINTRMEGNVRIAAMLNYGGRTYRTNDHSQAAGGSVRSGRSNSSATIQGRAQNYTFRAEHFVIEKEDYLSHPQMDVDRYAIRFSDPNYQIRGSEQYSNFTPIYENWMGWENIIYKHYAFTVNANTSISLSGQGPDGATLTIRINSPRGTAHAIRRRTRMRSKSAKPALAATSLPWDSFKRRVTYRDQNGNSHQIWFGNEDNGNILTLTNKEN